MDEGEEVGGGEVPLHLLEAGDEAVSQLGRLLVQNLLLAVLADDLNASRLKDHIHILVPLGQLGSQNLVFALQVPIHHWKGRVEIFLLVRDDVDDGVGVLEGSDEHLREQEDRIGEDSRVAADKHHLLFQHQQSQQI